MRKRTIAALIWQTLMGLISPIWCTFIFYFITGNGKGFGYDLREEKDLYVISGAVQLVMYLLAVVPVFVYLVKVFREKGKWMWLIPVSIFVLGCLCVVIIIGPKNFIF